MAIAAFKLLKSAICIAIATAAFRLPAGDAAEHLARHVESFAWLTRHGTVMHAVDWFQGLGPRQFHVFGSVAAAYALLYAVQGGGLWFGKRWAEYLVVLETGLLLPLEVWELVHRFAVLKLVVLVVNLAIVAYLVRVLVSGASRGGRHTSGG